MNTRRAETILIWTIKAGAYIMPFFLLVVAGNLFFPFITLKNFLFRITVEIMGAAWVGLLILDFSDHSGSARGGKKYWPKWNVLSIIFFTFVSLLFISALLGANFDNSFWSNFERMEGVYMHLHLLLLFFILAGVFRSRKDWVILFGVSIAASVFLAFYGLLEFKGLVKTYSDGSRIISTLGNPLYVAAYLSFHIFLTIYLWFNTKTPVIKWIFGGVFVFETIIFFLTGSRGAFLGIIAGFGLVLLLSAINIKDLKYRVALSGGLVFVAMIPFLLIGARNLSFVRNNNVLTRFAGISLADNTVQARFTIWKMALTSFKERPVFGWGPGNFIIPYAKNYDIKMFGNEPWFDRTHNMPLEWLTSGGLTVFLAYLGIFLCVLLAIIRATKQNRFTRRDAFIFIGMFAAYLTQMLFVFDILATYMVFIFLLGFFYAVSSSDDDLWTSRSSVKLPALSLSAGQISWFLSGVIVFSFLIYATNVRPLMASRSIIRAFEATSKGQINVISDNFNRALSLSKGTIGTPEIREQISQTVLQIPPEKIIEMQEIKDLYLLAVGEMEKQVASDKDGDFEIKHNIILGRLYDRYNMATGEPEYLQKSIEQYKKAIDYAPNYIQTYPLMVEPLYRSGDLDALKMVTDKVRAVFVSMGKFDQFLYSSVLIYAAIGDLDRSYQTIEDVIRLNGGYIEPSILQRASDFALQKGADERIISFVAKVSQLKEEMEEKDISSQNN